MKITDKKQKITVSLTPDIQSFLEETRTLFNYRSWSELIKTLIIAGLDAKKAIACKSDRK